MKSARAVFILNRIRDFLAVSPVIAVLIDVLRERDTNFSGRGLDLRGLLCRSSLIKEDSESGEEENDKDRTKNKPG